MSIASSSRDAASANLGISTRDAGEMTREELVAEINQLNSDNKKAKEAGQGNRSLKELKAEESAREKRGTELTKALKRRDQEASERTPATSGPEAQNKLRNHVLFHSGNSNKTLNAHWKKWVKFEKTDGFKDHEDVQAHEGNEHEQYFQRGKLHFHSQK
ncbi:MAG: hypothetical protein Q9159_004242 [Coniocarpon cinnabarinum]